MTALNMEAGGGEQDFALGPKKLWISLVPIKDNLYND